MREPPRLRGRARRHARVGRRIQVGLEGAKTKDEKQDVRTRVLELIWPPGSGNSFDFNEAKSCESIGSGAQPAAGSS